jgi:UPF0716 family protein affecting phage T7 exclusion
MNEDTQGRSIGKTVLAALVVIVAGYLLLVPIIHLISWLFGAVLVVAAVIALIWALRVLL